MANMSEMIPRVQGRVGQATEPEELKGKYFFEVYISFLGSGIDRVPVGTFGPYETEAEAQTELRSTCKKACESFEEALTGAVSGKYIDMKTNELKEWEKN